MKIIVRKPTSEEKETMLQQPTWASEVSTFDWEYSTEECSYVIAGRVTITYDGGSVEIQKGDYVIFPQGLSCVWNVTEPFEKHYILG